MPRHPTQPDPPRVAMYGRRRWYRVPDDRAVKTLREQFAIEFGADRALLFLAPEVQAGALVCIGKYKSQYYVSMTRGDLQITGWPNAVSGWGANPLAALQELAFRWCVLMECSWNPQEHVKQLGDR